MEKSTIIIQLQTVLPFCLTQKVSWTTTIFTRSKPTLESRIIVYTRNLILKFFRDTRSYSGHARSRLAERFGEEKFQIFNFL